VGLLRELEKRLEGVVEGFFARALPGGGVQPVELGKRMVRAMGEERTAGADGSTYVPNSFEFVLGPKDHERLDQIKNTLSKELIAVAQRAAANEGWLLVGPPEVFVTKDEDVRAGTFNVTARFVEGIAPHDEQAGPQTKLIQMSLAADAELVLLGRQSRTWPLSKEAVTIGRLDTCDVVVPDTGASRRHAEIRREGDEWVVIDLGSTNGTEVNGRRLSRHRLTDGDRLTIGETNLEFRKP
jgi:pSer/pThr/pTyr-binding forkhead associated (FHA) protein